MAGFLWTFLAGFLWTFLAGFSWTFLAGFPWTFLAGFPWTFLAGFFEDFRSGFLEIFPTGAGFPTDVGLPGGDAPARPIFRALNRPNGSLAGSLAAALPRPPAGRTSRS